MKGKEEEEVDDDGDDDEEEDCLQATSMGLPCAPGCLTARLEP